MPEGRLAREDVVAVDVHTHVEVGLDGHDHLTPELRGALDRYFRRPQALPTITEIAQHYRALKMMAVVFTVDASLTTGRPRIPNEDIVAAAAEHDDVLIPFASVDPRRGDAAVAEARRLIADGAVRGFKFHPNLQGFRANDRLAYPIYEAIAEADLVALFHTGHTGIGAGLPGGGGIRLRLGQPMDIDDVAVDFPTLRIVMAHPSFPWQDEAISIALHKPQVSIDLSGWSPKLLPPELVRHASRRLREQVLFGSDYPLIAPERWLAEFEELEVEPEARRLILRDNAMRLLGLEAA
jgi:predicted TIM-barrel fold metal-dependent hydrolase